MKTYKQFIAESMTDYEKAWDKHVSERKALEKAGFDHRSSGHRHADGVSSHRSDMVTHVLHPSGDEHNFYVTHYHNPYTRVNHSVTTKHTVVPSGWYASQDFDPGPERHLETKAHANIHDAIAHLDKLRSKL